MLNAPLAGIGEYAGNLNGLIPEQFASQLIKFRIPYSMPGELQLGPSTSGTQFNANTFLHNVDKPVEIHRMIVRLTGQDSDSVIPDVQPLTLDRRIRLTIQDTSKNELLTKNPHLVSTLQKQNEQTWEWEVPYTLTRQEGMTITVDTLAFPTICVPAVDDCTVEPLVIAFVRVEIAFQGYLIVLRPAGDDR